MKNLTVIQKLGSIATSLVLAGSLVACTTPSKEDRDISARIEQLEQQNKELEETLKETEELLKESSQIKEDIENGECRVIEINNKVVAYACFHHAEKEYGKASG